MPSKRRLLIVIIICTVVVAGLLLLFRGSPSPDNGPPEPSSPGTVVIDNTDQLRDILLARQYAVVNRELVNYIFAKIDDKVEHAYIVSGSISNKGGLVSFRVQTEQPDQQFKVDLDRGKDFDKIVFTVSGTDYSKTLDVYGDEEIGE